MTQAHIIVKYDGPALADHKMEVEQLAPALLALADLVKRANRLANGDRASVRVLVDVDVEEHCFSFGIEIVQTLMEQAKSLLVDDDVSTAIAIAEIVGVAGSGIGGLFGILRFLRGRKPDSVKMVVQDGRQVTQINIGRDAYIAAPIAAKLLEDQAAIKDAKTVTQPVTTDGYESIEFISGPRREMVNKQEAAAIQDMSLPGAKIETTIPPSKVRAWVKIRRAVYDGGSKWTVQYDRARDVTFNDVDWLGRFQRNVETAPPGSWLDVEMSVSAIELDGRGQPIREPEYAIDKVHDVRKPDVAMGLFDAVKDDQSPGGSEEEQP